MKVRTLAMPVALGAALLLSAGCAEQARKPYYAYTETVTLKSGKNVECAVNEPLADRTTAGPPLTVTERRQAEVLAMHRLFLVTDPWSPYPTPYTAPDIKCRTVP